MGNQTAWDLLWSYFSSLFFMKVVWGHLHSNQGIPWSPAQNDSPGCQEDRHNQRDYDRSDHHLPSFDQLTACPGTSKVNI